MLTHTQHTEQRGSFSSQTTQSTNTFLHTHSNTTVHSKQAHKDTDTTHKQATAQGIQYNILLITIVFISIVIMEGQTFLTWLIFTVCILSSHSHENNMETYDTTGNDQDAVLRPEAGVYFKPLGPLNPYGNSIYLAINIKLPDPLLIEPTFREINCSALLQPRKISMTYDRAYYQKKYNLRLFSDDKGIMKTIKKELADRSASGIELCSDYETILSEYRRSMVYYHQVITREMKDIHVALYHSNSNTRSKRFVFSAAIPFIVAAGKAALTIGTTALSYVRHKAMMGALDSLRKDNAHMNDYMVDYNNKTALYNVHMNENIQNLQNQITSTRKEVKALANSTHQELSLLSSRMETAKATSIYLTNLVSKLQTHATILISKNLYYLFMYRTYVRQFIQGVVELKKGQLSPNLVGPDRLTSILQKTNKMLKTVTRNDYELLSTNPIDYYKREDVIYETEGNNVIMQIPLPVRKNTLGTLYFTNFNMFMYHMTLLNKQTQTIQ